MSAMNVISYKMIRAFLNTRPDADSSLNAWYKAARKASWQNLAEVKQMYPHADLVGRYTVFNIKGNDYRVITRIVYRSQAIFIIAVLTHEEYDKDKWKA
jgi:mRNA interferase HigB